MLARQSLSLYRTWQKVDSLESDPYIAASVLSAAPDALPPGRLCLIGSRLDAAIISDVHADCLASGQYLRVYTIGVAGRGVAKPPKSREDIADCDALMLSRDTHARVKATVEDVLGIRQAVEAIPTRPWLLNRLWEHPLFSHINIFGWKSDMVFARAHFRNVFLYALRNTSCITHLTCQQNPSITLADVEIRTPGPRRLRIG